MSSDRIRRPSSERLPGRPSAGRRSSFGRASSLLGFNRAEKVQLLAERSPLGAYLSHDELNRLSKLCTIARFSKGKPIQADSPFYLVIDGVVAVMDDDAVTHRTLILTLTLALALALALARALALALTLTLTLTLTVTRNRTQNRTRSRTRTRTRTLTR